MKFKKTMLMQKLTINKALILIYTLMIGDYLITYLGVNILGIITEANPILINLMNISFYKALIIRLITCLIPIFFLKLIQHKYKKIDRYQKIIISLLYIQIIPYTLHLLWISIYIISK